MVPQSAGAAASLQQSRAPHKLYALRLALNGFNNNNAANHFYALISFFFTY